MANRASQLGQDLALKVDVTGILRCKPDQHLQRLIEARERCRIGKRKGIAGVLRRVDIEGTNGDAGGYAYAQARRPASSL